MAVRLRRQVGFSRFSQTLKLEEEEEPLQRLPADHLIAGPQIAGYKLAHNDEYHLLVVNHRIAPLTPTEYILSMALLRVRERWEAATGQVPLCASFADLQRVTGIRQRNLLSKHVSNASCKLAPLGIRFACVGEGYMTLFEADLSYSERETTSARR